MGSTAHQAPVEHPVHYERHRPEHSLLYQLVEEHFPAFKAHLEAQGTALPPYVEQEEFEDYLKCGRLEHGFLRVRCDSCHAEHLVAISCKKRGFFTRAAGEPRPNVQWTFAACERPDREVRAGG